MKPSRLFLFFTLLAAAMLLSACAGGAVGPSSWPGVTVDEEAQLAYVASYTHIYAVNLDGGTLKWKYPTNNGSPSSTFYAAPVLTPDGQLLAASYDHKLYSLNPATGELNWTFSEASDLFVASPLVTADGIYAPNADGNLYALNFSGQQLWKFPTESHLWATPIADPACDCLYLPAMDHHLYAINAETGAEIWHSEDFGGALIAQPTYDDGLVYVGTFNNEIVALDAKTGSVRWRTPTSGWIYSSVVIANEQLIVGDLKGTLYALERGSGSVLWQKSMPELRPLYATPLVTEETIYVTIGSDAVYAYDLSGTSEWSQPVLEDAKIQGSPAAAGEMVLVSTSNLQSPLAALNTNGTYRWLFTVPKE